MKKYELLSPAGDMASLIAAVKAGADAVYLGGEEFSARKKAKNFSKEELKTAILYCHMRMVKVYVAINTILTDEEVFMAFSYVKFLREIGVDGLIVQDIGLAKVLRDNFTGLELHASTQMSINSYSGAKMLKEMGFHRVVVARECPISEIEKIKSLGIEVEGFIHGALCISYSGQCLMSSMIGGRSGNRGECAQPCRKRYEILDENKNKISAKGEYVLSPRDLASFNTVEEMIDAGVYSLKIEGRMKRPEYVYQVTKTYREILEGHFNKDDVEKTRALFNRKFTKGIGHNERGEDFISYDRPSNRGVVVGEVLKKSKDGYILKFSEDVVKGDELEFALKNKGTFKILSPIECEKDKTVEFPTTRDLKPKSEIRRLNSVELIKSINEEINSKNLNREVSIAAEFFKGKRPKLVFTSLGITAEVEGYFKLEEPKTHAVSEERIIESLSKLGDTDFYLKEIYIECDEIFIPISKLNELRRIGIEKLKSEILKTDVEDAKNLHSEFKKRDKAEPFIALEVGDLNNLKGVDLNKVGKIYLKDKAIDENYLSALKDFKGEVFVSLNNIYYTEEEEKILQKIKAMGIINVEVNNWGQLQSFKDFNLHLGHELNIFNSYAGDFALKLGKSFSVSEETTLDQIEKISKNIGGNIERTVYGHVKVMTMEHNPLDLTEIKDRAGVYFLKDVTGAAFPFIKGSTTDIYTDRPVDLRGDVDALVSAGVNILRVRINFPWERAAEIVEDIYYKRQNVKDGFKGHLYRGVL